MSKPIVIKVMQHCLYAKDKSAGCAGCPFEKSDPPSNCFFRAFDGALKIIEARDKEIKRLKKENGLLEEQIGLMYDELSHGNPSAG